MCAASFKAPSTGWMNSGLDGDSAERLGECPLRTTEVVTWLSLRVKSPDPAGVNDVATMHWLLQIQQNARAAANFAVRTMCARLAEATTNVKLLPKLQTSIWTTTQHKLQGSV